MKDAELASSKHSCTFWRKPVMVNGEQQVYMKQSRYRVSHKSEIIDIYNKDLLGIGSFTFFAIFGKTGACPPPTQCWREERGLLKILGRHPHATTIFNTLNPSMGSYGIYRVRHKSRYTWQIDHN
jgi:hypothetical protein